MVSTRHQSTVSAEFQIFLCYVSQRDTACLVFSQTTCRVFICSLGISPGSLFPHLAMLLVVPHEGSLPASHTRHNKFRTVSKVCCVACHSLEKLGGVRSKRISRPEFVKYMLEFLRT